MNNRRKLFNKIDSFIMATGLGLVMLFSGCTEVVDWDTKNDQQLVVEGVVTSENKKHYVNLSATLGIYSEKDTPTISNAVVTISDGTSVYTLEEHPEKKGFYETTEAFAGEPGKTYRLDIRLAEPVGGVRTVQAISVMPPRVMVDSMKVVNETTEISTEWYSIKLFGRDSKEADSYCHMYVYNNGTLITDRLDQLVYYNSQDSEANLSEYTINQDNISYGDSVTVEIQSVAKEYYQYVSDLKEKMYLYYGDSDQSSKSSSNVYGNISNNVFGYFYATAVTRLEEVAE